VKQCLFCHNKADSLEHVLPQWLYRRIAPERGGVLPVLVGRFVEGKGYLDQRKHLSLGFKARIVCTECNTGWMSQLESKAAHILTPLMAEQFPVLAHSFFESLRSDSASIALWLSKTALTTAFALPGRQRLPEFVSSFIAKQQVPPGTWVDVAKARITAIGAGLTKQFPMINGGVFTGIQSHNEGTCFQFCLQVNQLLLRVAMSPGAKINYFSPDGSISYRIYPRAARQIPGNFEYDDLNHFCQSIVLSTWADCPGEIPPPGQEESGRILRL